MKTSRFASVTFCCLIALSYPVVAGAQFHTLTDSAAFETQWFFTAPASPVEGREGQAVTSIPLPPALWLFGSGLMGIAVVARRRKNDGEGPTNRSRKRPSRFHLFHRHGGDHEPTAGH